MMQPARTILINNTSATETPGAYAVQFRSDSVISAMSNTTLQNFAGQTLKQGDGIIFCSFTSITLSSGTAIVYCA